MAGLPHLLLEHTHTGKVDVNGNVLICSAGRRAKLLEQFKFELGKILPKGKVLATDLNPKMSSACQLADASFQMPRVSAPSYIDKLLKLCVEQQIKIVIPTIDHELITLAANRKRFLEHGIEVVVSDLPLVSECRDKRKTIDLFSRHNTDSPRWISTPTSNDLPLIAKPHDGSCSKSLIIIHNKAELEAAKNITPQLTFFEYLCHQSHNEYTVDAYFDKSSQLICMVPRLRIEVRGGEVSKSMTSHCHALEFVRDEYSHLLGARGCLTMQFFVNHETHKVSGIEINPRFGGGFPLTYEAGGNYPKWILEEYLLGKSVEPYHEWTNQLTMLRYDAHVLVSGAAA